MSKPDKATIECPQFVRVRFNDSLRLINCCRIRAKGALFIKGMRCVGRSHEQCPLVIAEKLAQPDNPN